MNDPLTTLANEDEGDDIITDRQSERVLHGIPVPVFPFPADPVKLCEARGRRDRRTPRRRHAGEGTAGEVTVLG
jgi:hypothetical protein